MQTLSVSHAENTKASKTKGKGQTFPFLQHTAQFAGKIISVKILPKREGEPHTLTADNSKAQKILNWSPTLELGPIIESAWKWHQHLLEYGRPIKASFGQRC